MKIEKTNWIIFNIEDLPNIADIDPNIAPNSTEDMEMQKPDGDLYGVGVECVTPEGSMLVVLDFLVKPNMISQEVTKLKKSGTLYYKEPFSDHEFKIVDKCKGSFSRIFPKNSEEENLRRIFNIAWTSRCSYPTSSYDMRMFNTEASGDEYQRLKIGDIVNVNFKGGITGAGIFTGVSAEGKETRISVIWIETFCIPTLTETVTFYLGSEAPVPHSAIQKLEAA